MNQLKYPEGFDDAVEKAIDHLHDSHIQGEPSWKHIARAGVYAVLALAHATNTPGGRR